MGQEEGHAQSKMFQILKDGGCQNPREKIEGVYSGMGIGGVFLLLR